MDRVFDVTLLFTAQFIKSFKYRILRSLTKQCGSTKRKSLAFLSHQSSAYIDDQHTKACLSLVTVHNLKV